MPAFRAVAETEHLPTAASKLFVTPPSLSRTLGNLERALGQRLFDRVGRNLRLNDSGRAFLSAVRAAMRLVDEGVQTVTSSALLGSVTIAARCDHADVFVLPAIHRLTRAHPGIEPRIVPIDESAANGQLLRGEIDVAIAVSPPRHAEIVAEPLSDLTHGIYCHRDHPLCDAEEISVDAIAAHPFVAVAQPGLAQDAWPLDKPRRVQAYVDNQLLALGLCARHRMLAVLPAELVATHPLGRTLQRLPLDITPKAQLLMLHRVAIRVHARTDEVLAALRASATDLDPPQR